MDVKVSANSRYILVFFFLILLFLQKLYTVATWKTQFPRSTYRADFTLYKLLYKTGKRCTLRLYYWGVNTFNINPPVYDVASLVVFVGTGHSAEGRVLALSSDIFVWRFFVLIKLNFPCCTEDVFKITWASVSRCQVCSGARHWFYAESVYQVSMALRGVCIPDIDTSTRSLYTRYRCFYAESVYQVSMALRWVFTVYQVSIYKFGSPAVGIPFRAWPPAFVTATPPPPII